MNRSALLAVFVLLIVIAFFLTMHTGSSPYQQQEMYVLVLTGSRYNAYTVSVSWVRPNPTAVYGPMVDRNQGIVLFRFDLPYAPDVNEVSVHFPTGIGRLVISPPASLVSPVVVVDIAPSGNTAYVFLCSNATVYRGTDGLIRYMGLCSGPYILSPNTTKIIRPDEVR